MSLAVRDDGRCIRHNMLAESGIKIVNKREERNTIEAKLQTGKKIKYTDADQTHSDKKRKRMDKEGVEKRPEEYYDAPKPKRAKSVKSMSMLSLKHTGKQKEKPSTPVRRIPKDGLKRDKDGFATPAPIPRKKFQTPPRTPVVQPVRPGVPKVAAKKSTTRKAKLAGF